MDITELRAEINAVDDEILALFIKRMEISAGIAEYKRARSIPVLDEKREREILDAVQKKAGADGEYAERLFETIMKLSREKQTKLLHEKDSKPFYGLIGRKLSHSYSVPIHHELGCADYCLKELEPYEIKDFFNDTDIGGLNITIPYKKDVIKYCAELSKEAEETGCVNTVFQHNGKLKGCNTDIYGFLYMIRRKKIMLAGKKVVVFGSGGASSAVCYALKMSGAREIAVISRNGTDNYNNLERHRDAEILVNATPVGMYPNEESCPADPACFPYCRAAVDLIYNPRRTDFLIKAASLGMICTDGLPMLVAQAKAARELFTGALIDDCETERVIEKIGRDMENIVLIGMPGSGKSTVGAYLAKFHGRKLIDTDTVIETSQNRTVADIFAHDGEAYFRKLEREIIADAGKQSGAVIVCGGGAVTTVENYLPLHRNSRIYHLTRPTELLSRDSRPLSSGADLNDMYQKRLPLYEKFRDAVVENTTPEEAAAEIWREFNENSRA